MSASPSRASTDDAHAAEPSARVPGLGLPRAAKLLSTEAFDWVFAAPQRSSDQYFSVLGRPPPPSSSAGRSARLGLAIAKRCAQRAVARNRIKRVIRESFRQARGSLRSLDIVVLCRRAAVDADNATLYASLMKHWERFQR
ncbi:MAG: ribonuclease P protein component [Lamprobacter sp.]|uniref:ribonuclease P protein component n=1 Tax=Lamprobacter sp. TaxID=3100796 RepID=UPI002B25F1F5|nr:ribonuclease P protein component [Lamprobacter sp.]MEA3638384.1 ribonuclease P protein component [Lamprobacter sp.]